MIIKKSEKDERREKIIDVAFRLFVDKKIESVTMGEIAKEAGIGRATSASHHRRSTDVLFIEFGISEFYLLRFRATGRNIPNLF